MSGRSRRSNLEAVPMYGFAAGRMNRIPPRTSRDGSLFVFLPSTTTSA
jgi:hypothetical protein